MDAVDDPYKMLAHTLVVTCSDNEIINLLHDSKVIKKHLADEVHEADFCGNFIDCIMVDVIKQGRSRSINPTLKDTVNFFYSFTC